MTQPIQGDKSLTMMREPPRADTRDRATRESSSDSAGVSQSTREAGPMREPELARSRQVLETLDSAQRPPVGKPIEDSREAWGLIDQLKAQFARAPRDALAALSGGASDNAAGLSALLHAAPAA